MEPVNEDRPAGVPGEDPAALVVAVGVIRQAHCAGELPDDGREGSRGAVLGDDAEIVEGDEQLIEFRLLAGPFERDWATGCRGVKGSGLLELKKAIIMSIIEKR